nr:hypothetical protein [Tanacetum cinerariifolium]
GKPQNDDKGFINSGCSRHMTENITYLSDFKEFDRGYVAFEGGAHGCRISGKAPNFKLPDESQILLKIPRKDNMYSFDMKNIVPKESLTCLDNLVRGLPLKRFENDQTCVACLKGKQHRASSTKDATSEILKNFIKEIENLVDKKVKIIRCDNRKEFRNKVMDDFCIEKGIKREYSIARTHWQNGVAERKNRTLIEAAKTMLPDSKLPTTFWAKAVSTACYVQNRVLIVKPHNKTPYENFRGTISDESAGTQGDLNAGTSSRKEATSQDYINDDKDKSEDDSSPKKVNAAGQHVNIASLEVNIRCFKLNTASSSEPHSPTDMFKLGASDTLEATHVEYFSDRDAPEVDLGNIPNSYRVPTTLHTRIHKDHIIEHVVGEVQSFVQTRRMTKPTYEKGFSVLYMKRKQMSP